MSEHFAHFGPSGIRSYPKKYLHPANIDPVIVWQIVGPTVQHLIDNFPIWQVCISCYLEGLNHGSEAVRENLEGARTWR